MADDSFAAMCQSAKQRPPRVAVVLGSGLGAIAERIGTLHCVPFEAIPSLRAATVEGHAGQLILGHWAGQGVLVFCGRIHAYEGCTHEQIIAPIRVTAMLGVRELILTNAAGGIRDDLVPGAFMSIRRHVDLTQSGRWDGDGHFQALCSVRLSLALSRAAERLGVEILEGTFAAMLGPNYETPAEIRALRSRGVDAVGMSTAAEIETAAELGIECLAISCITNRAAGLSETRLTHEEVLANSQRQARRLGDLIEGMIEVVGTLRVL